MDGLRNSAHNVLLSTGYAELYELGFPYKYTHEYSLSHPHALARIIYASGEITSIFRIWSGTTIKCIKPSLEYHPISKGTTSAYTDVMICHRKLAGIYHIHKHA